MTEECFHILADQEALRLAYHHNSNGHFIHRMSHKDYVSSATTKLLNKGHLKLRGSLLKMYCHGPIGTIELVNYRDLKGVL